MEKKICSYETLFVLNGTYTEEVFKALEEKFVNLVNENATDVNVNEWGKKRLAYPIDDITEGYYVLVTFKSEPSFPLELERVFGITEGVLRYMTTVAPEKKAAKTEAPAQAEAEATVEVAESTEA